MQLIEEAFNSANLDVVGVQEGRTPSDQRKSGVYYEMLIAGHQRGQYGSQVWVRRSPTTTIVSWRVISTRIVETIIIYDEIERLVAFVSAHAPHEFTQESVKEEFWKLLYNSVAALHARGRDVILLIDANARVGQYTCYAIGPNQAVLENDNGLRFRSCISSLQMRAMNTFNDAGGTWMSNSGTLHRLDYVCFSQGLVELAGVSEVVSDIDLSTADRIDHLCLAQGAYLTRVEKPCSEVDQILSRVRKVSFDKSKLSVPYLQDQFEHHMWTFRCSRNASIEEQHSELVAFINTAARKTFGAPQASPIKGWISAETWLYLKPVSCLRKLQLTALSYSRRAFTRICVVAWAACVHQPFAPLRKRISGKQCCANYVPYTGLLGWVAASSVDTYRQQYYLICRIGAVASRAAALLHFAADRNVVVDRIAYFEKLAITAQKCAMGGDIRGTFAVVKKMKGFQVRPQKTVLLKDGTVASNENARQA